MPLLSQGQIRLLSTDSKPIEGAFVKLFSIGSGESNFYISDNLGYVNFEDHSGSYPAILLARHIGFKQYVDSSFTKTSSPVILMESTTSELEGVIITGEYEPLSARASIYNIQSINQVELTQRGAKNLEDALRTSLNIRLNKDPSTSTTSLRMQGISGENIKVLVDGVPLVGKVANQTDLNQIDINAIEQIEIIEGPMAVAYGTDALGGVINVITKKSQPGEWYLQLGIHEESAGGEYSIEEGIHNQHITAGVNSKRGYSGQLSFTHNYFGGYYGESQERSSQWDPKTQYLASTVASFNTGKLKTFYKLDYLNEQIENLGDINGLFNPIAADENYRTRRYIHQIQTSGKISNTTKLIGILSYSDYERQKSTYIKNFRTGERPLSTADGSQDTTSYQTLNFRATSTVLPRSSKLNVQMGMDINLNSASGGRIQGSSEKSLQDYAIFASVEWKTNDWKIRPALRATYNSLFNTPVIPSFHVLKNFGSQLTAKFGYGRGFRSPSITELYFEFIDSNHTIIGNKELIPEDGHHLDLSLSYISKSGSFNNVQIDLSFFYNRISDRIDFGQSPTDQTVTTYINIDEFRSLGSNLSISFRKGKLSTTTGLGYIGTASNFASAQLADILYTPELIQTIEFAINSKFTTSGYFKFTGKQPFYTLDEGVESIEERASFSWLDLTIGYRFSDSFLLTAGIKNLLDITNVQSSLDGPAGAHSGGTITPISYGRSGFLKLNFRINSNQTTN